MITIKNEDEECKEDSSKIPRILRKAVIQTIQNISYKIDHKRLYYLKK